MNKADFETTEKFEFSPDLLLPLEFQDAAQLDLLLPEAPPLLESPCDVTSEESETDEEHQQRWDFQMLPSSFATTDIDTLVDF